MSRSLRNLAVWSVLILDSDLCSFAVGIPRQSGFGRFFLSINSITLWNQKNGSKPEEIILVLIHRKRDCERGSFADIAGNPHSPVVLLDDAFDDGQTEPLPS